MNASILEAIIKERARQDELHPNDEMFFLNIAPAVLGEEVGEVNKAWLEHDRDSLREELVQVAAVAVRWLELL